MKLKNIFSKQHLIIFCVFFIAVFLRLFLIKDNKIYFWFDQARDANLSRQIIENRDLKIQGPSASGTNDTIYHGVLYYYLIGPIYSLSGGNPFIVASVLAIIGSLAIPSFYYLCLAVTESKQTAILASILLAISFEHAQYSTWISNPSLALLPIIFYYLSLWKIFYTNKIKPHYFLIMGLSLGLIEQSAFYTLYLWGSLIIAFAYYLTHNTTKLQAKTTKKGILNTVVFLSSYLLMISTMIFAQIKLFTDNIFKPKDLFSSIGLSKLVEHENITELVVTYLKKTLESLFPFYSILGFVCLLFLISHLLKEFTKKQKVFLASWFFAPLWLFVFHFRESIHMLIGVEYVVILILASFIVYIFNKKHWINKIAASLILVIFAFAQFKAILFVRQNNMSIFTFQINVLLDNEIKLIDRTYELANGENFSISLWVSPYEYYITWAYLYDWYGLKKYGYVPTYVGTSQVGKFGENLLPQADYPPFTKHFAIFEPELILVGDFDKQFINEQNSVSTPVLTDQSNPHGIELFGSYELWIRKKVDN